MCRPIEVIDAVSNVADTRYSNAPTTTSHYERSYATAVAHVPTDSTQHATLILFDDANHVRARYTGNEELSSVLRCCPTTLMLLSPRKVAALAGMTDGMTAEDAAAYAAHEYRRLARRVARWPHPVTIAYL